MIKATKSGIIELKKRVNNQDYHTDFTVRVHDIDTGEMHTLGLWLGVSWTRPGAFNVYVNFVDGEQLDDAWWIGTARMGLSDRSAAALIILAWEFAS